MRRYWIKLWIDLLDDAKFGELPDWQWRRFFEFCLVAGELGQDGLLPPVKQLAWRIRTPENKCRDALLALSEVGVVTEKPEGWYIVNFAKRQSPVDPAERQRQHRISHEPVTNCDTRSDTEEETEKDANASAGKKPAQAPEPPPKTKERKEPWIHRFELRDYFCQVAKLSPPKLATDGERKAAQKFWWNPIDDLFGQVGKETEQVKQLIDLSVAEHDRKGLPVSDPNSIWKTARSIYARNNRTPNDNSGYTRA